MQKTAKIFMNGRSQAVRLPAAFRVEADEVFIRKNEKGEIILSPKPTNWEDVWALGPYEGEIDFRGDLDSTLPPDPFQGWQE